jgi:sec-independent protein translocase protein TatC
MVDTHKKDYLHNSTMSLEEHLDELRRRLIFSISGLVIAIIFCLFFGKAIISFIEKPYIESMGKDARLQILSPAEGFTSYMQIAGVSGVILASPWIFYQLWMFISAGLYPHERRYVYIAVPFSTILFVAGALLFLFLIAPLTLKFFVIFNREFLNVDSNYTFPKYISFIAIMMLVFGIAFQTPIAIFFLIKTGLISVKTLNRTRKYVILGIIIAASCVIPGSDPFSLFAMSIPMYLLFELGILLGYLSEQKRKKRENSI